MELQEQLRGVKSRNDLKRFVEALRDDLQKIPNDWKNASLDAFLESMAGWIGEMDRYYRNKGEAMSEDQPWELFAAILAASTTYNSGAPKGHWVADVSLICEGQEAD